MFDPKILLDAMMAGASEGTQKTRQGASGLGGMLGDLLNQATSGVKEGTQDFGKKTGADNILNDLIGQFAGNQSADELLNKAKDLIGGNQATAGAIAGALGGLLLGSKTGRSLSLNAAKLGGLILIGGLAYKAYKNYSAGSPVEESLKDDPEAAPTGSGFEADVQTNDNAMAFVKAMIAAAASDGEISEAERSAILGNMKQAGLNPEAADFLSSEFTTPASVQDLVSAAGGDEKSALQIYTAARLTIEPDTYAEKGFLSELAKGLGLDETLVEHINGQVKSVKV